MKLQNMTDFVLEQTELLYEKNTSKLIHNIVNYAQFLKQSLTLGMFIPIDQTSECFAFGRDFENEFVNLTLNFI